MEGIGGFGSFHSRHCGAVRCAAGRLGVPSAAVDDVVQEVFLVAFRRWDAFEGRSSERRWLLGITRRVASRHRRTQNRRHRKHAELQRVPLGRERSLLDQVALTQARELLDDFCAELPAAQRKVFEALERSHRTARELAAELGVSVNTIHSRLRLARRAFRRFAEEVRTPA